MLVLLIIVFLASPVFALHPGVAVSQYPQDAWRAGNGLLSDSVRAMVQTKDSYLWFATSAGLSRFDGERFESFYKNTVPEMSVDSITSLLEDRDGSLWVGTEGGGLLNYKDRRFMVFTTSDGLPDNYISALAQDGEGNVWIATRTELVILKKGEFLRMAISRVHALYADSTTVWIGAEDGLHVARGSTIIDYPATAVTALHKTRSGDLLLAVRNRGLCQLAAGQIVTLLATTEGITSILEDRDQNLWIGTFRGLQRLLDKTVQALRDFDIPVTSLLEDNEGSVWIATLQSGVHRLRPSPFVTFTNDDGLVDNRTWSVLQDKAGEVWIGTDSGVSQWKDNTFLNYPTPGPVKALAIDGTGILWIAAPGAVMRWNQNMFSIAIPAVSASSIQADPSGGLWIGAKDGLYKYNHGKLEKKGAEEVTTLYQDSKSILWIGTTNGLRRWNNESVEPWLIEDPVLCIQEDRLGDLWVGSSRGVQCIHNRKITIYTAQNGLPHELVFSILEDRAGNLWMSGRRGVFRMERNPHGIHCVTYDSSKGLGSSECADGKPAGWKMADGKFWFATVHGVGVIDPDHYYVNRLPPPVVIESMIVDRVTVRNIHAADLRLPAGSSRVEIYYAGISFLPWQKFRYVLQGFDQFWTNAGGHRSATYTNLPPGKYRFKVLACNSDGVWNIEGKGIAFEIPATAFSFHKSSIFKFVVAALLGFGAGWLAKKRRLAGRSNRSEKDRVSSRL